MPIIKKDNNRSSQKNSILFLISLIIIISVGILFLIIGYGIYSPSTKNIYLDNGLITIPKIGHIDLIKDSNNKFFIL
jgi:multidrug resistance efflux pump